ncbi:MULTISPECIES: hypothetical protein [Aeromicrobium]|uniref:hypothetical protein n=1 Tax=Aeromicrobium TaxID=2040 RepID=UPI0006FFA025|nr:MULTISPECIES: hypothetical protein [Aeromicrobium]KQX73831.1 hypothetical protein ASD10_00715 [Aeromicrobium sp. Root472D3]MCL8253147.1 hypothetical protein [Aeromicrobium fastidiosum]
MRFRRSGALGAQANAAVNDFASRADGRATEVAERATQVIVLAVRVLRIPTAIVGALSVPFIAATLVLGLLAGGGVGVVVLVAGVVLAVVNGLFWGRRHRILRAVDDPRRLATELAVMLSMTGKVEEARGMLTQVAGASGGWRVMGRLRGIWSGTQMTGRWIDEIGDLPRARYFGPPKIGTTITISVATLWLVPVSIVVALFSLVGTIAGAF